MENHGGKNFKAREKQCKFLFTVQSVSVHMCMMSRLYSLLPAITFCKYKHDE